LFRLVNSKHFFTKIIGTERVKHALREWLFVVLASGPANRYFWRKNTLWKDSWSSPYIECYVFFPKMPNFWPSLCRIFKVRMSKCSNCPIFEMSLYRNLKVWMSKCSNFHIFECQNVQISTFSNYIPHFWLIGLLFLVTILPLGAYLG
jgi:hypothetical protein